MLQFLQTGKVLYIIAGVCALGMMSKLVTSSLYKRLIKETGNMALTKNKNLKTLKQRTENMILLNHGIRNTQAYIEKQMHSFKFCHASLDSWDNLSVQAMILCFLVGGVAAFASYWSRSDTYYIVLYGSMGILSGLLLVLVDNGTNISLKRRQLADSLIDYVENSPHFYKSVDNTGNGTVTEKKSNAAGIIRPHIRERSRKADQGVAETAAGEETGSVSEHENSERRTSHFLIEERAADRPDSAVKAENARNGRQGSRFSVLSRKKDVVKDGTPTKCREKEAASEMKSGENVRHMERSGDDELARSIEHLRQSLEQIAAGREQMKKEVQEPEEAEKSGLARARNELNPGDIKLLGELLQEYLT